MNKLITKKRILVFSLYVLLAIIIFCFFDIYFFGYKTDLSKFTAKIVPYPALVINNNVVTIRRYENFLKNYKLYLEEFNKIEDKFDDKLALKAMIQDIALEQILSKLDIEIDEQEFNDYVNKFYSNNTIKVDKNKFNDYFLKLLFHRQKISEEITDDKFNLENKKKIEIIYGDLTKNPDMFSNYSEIYKDVNFGIDGKQLGWLPYRNLPESLKLKVEKMQLGDLTPIIKSISGYHIYKLNGKIEDEDNSYYYQFDQIFLPVNNFNDYLDNYLQKSKLFYFLKTARF